MAKQEGMAHGALMLIALGALLYVASWLITPSLANSSPVTAVSSVIEEMAPERNPALRGAVGVQHLVAVSAASSGPNAAYGF
jgi:hypothetical protein